MNEFAPQKGEYRGFEWYERERADGFIKDHEVRLDCLRIAADVAKLGLSHDVYATAERYYRFATGQPVEDTNDNLTFYGRLDALVAEFIADGRSDPHKVKHDIGEWYEEYDDRHPSPALPGDRLLSENEAETALAEVFDSQPNRDMSQEEFDAKLLATIAS